MPDGSGALASTGFRALILEGDELVTTRELDAVTAAHAAGKRFWVELVEKTAVTDKLLGEVLKIHPVAIEDVWNDIGLPKVEDFHEYVLLVMHGVLDKDVEGDDVPLGLAELDMVIGRNFLVTHANDEKVCAVSPVLTEVQRNAKQMKKGPAWVAHAIVDRLVDEYIPVVDRFEREIIEAEAHILEGRASRKQDVTLRQILRIKRSLQMLRRTTIGQREILHRLARAEFDEIPRELIPFFRDVYDHFARVTELVDSYRELTGALIDAHFAMQSQQMNEIMKRLTLISTIMLPLSLIAGIYGMNFKHVFPELDLEYGYFYALGLMAFVATSIVLYFRKKRWL
ncbi:MAG: magnesium/cobalt transporter CorA [Labilithrix sp.]|nr:magnesium/cobalt transporter CorA [Labilithrix sp.]MCW5816914.1 magnesium/cobalt transporter CorA [Labilithrix sp.]